MNRLQKFVEADPHGSRPVQVAYAMGVGKLPDAAHGMSWHQVEDFNAGDEILKDAGLKDVFKTAIGVGCAVVDVRD
jgi:hypothetical protein